MKNIQLNFQRLCDTEYSMDKVFQAPSYDWPGDYEGRALLAFLCHYEINQSKVPHLHKFFNTLPQKTNQFHYFGKVFDGKVVDEQQLSGHNWYLRGLLKYAKLFDDNTAMQFAKSTVENLYLPTLKWFYNYPLNRDTDNGGVAGNIADSRDGWNLSTDVGCAFMCVDGLAHYYQETKDEKVKNFLDRLIDLFLSIDLIKCKLQTHSTLSCLRGILTLYFATQDQKYLQIVKQKFAFYEENGMTLTYENFNWFDRKDTWTEPCAVVDSLILSIGLYKITQNEKYKTLARRIWFNGLQFCQRENGGAGPNSCVYGNKNVLKIELYEAGFCCTMRYAEGLLTYAKNQSLFSWNSQAKIVTDEFGRSFIDDVLLVKYNGQTMPIFSCNTFTKKQAEQLELIIF